MKKINLKKEFLKKEYIEKKLSTSQIARKINCNTSTIYSRLIKYKIPIRTVKEATKLCKHHEKYNIDINKIRNLYWKRKFSISKIAKYLKHSESVIYYRMIKYNIRRRDISQANKGISRPRMSGPLNSRWKGGRRKDKDGYIILWNANSKYHYVLEHRDIMEKELKRKLNSNELVHHLNGIRDDNRIENLVIVNSHNHERHTLLKLAKKRIKELEKQLEKFKKEGKIKEIKD